MKTYDQLLADPPKTVATSEVVNPLSLEERRLSVDVLYADTIGVDNGLVEWCPNDNPPSTAETLAWLWFIRPDLGDEIAHDAPDDLRNLILKFQDGDMETWWREMRD